MPFYECVFIARQDISGTQVEALTENLAGIISEQGGSVTKREYWGLKNLSFRIKKNRKGHYGLINIDAPAAAVTEMERTMRINEDVLRFLTVRVEELEEGPSSAMQNRGAREDRPRRGFGDKFGGDSKFGGGDKFGGDNKFGGGDKFGGGENKFAGERAGFQGGEG